MMLQDIDPYKYRVEYRELKPEDDDYIILRKEDLALVKKVEGEIAFPTWKDARRVLNGKMEGLEVRYLFEIEGAGRLFHVWKGDSDSLIDSLGKQGHELMSQRNLQHCRPRWAAFAGTTAFHFTDWYIQNQYCGKCGAPMQHDEKERMLKCEHCNIPIYPRINPVIIVGVIDGERMLLTKYAHAAYKNYALVAGFMEVGESVEDTVAREVMEETGLRIKNVRYFSSQPWSLSGSMILGLFCDLDGSDQVSMDDGELAVAEWVNREDIPYQKDTISVTGALMNAFIERKEK